MDERQFVELSPRKLKAKTLELRSQRNRSGPPRREARALVLWVHVHWFELWGNPQGRSASSESDASRDRNVEERKRNGQRVHVESNHWQRFQEAYRPQQCGSRSGIEGCSYSLRVRQWSSLRDGRRATKWSDMGQLFQVLTIRKQLQFLRIEGVVS